MSLKSRIKPIVLFINMVNPARNIENLYPQLAPAYLVAYVNKNLSNKIDFHMISSEFEKTILKIKPDIVAISSVSQNYNRTKDIAKFSKKAGVSTVIVGGSHISLFPASLTTDFDIGVIGEGEQTFLELMKIFVSQQKFSHKDLQKIDGLAFWDEGELKYTARRSLIKCLDDLPFPDRSLFKIDPNKAYMFSSRGCPYKCVFCASTRLWDKVRFHSAEYVVQEIKELVEKYNVKRIDFYDDLFIASKKRLIEIVSLIKREGINKYVEFHLSGRANLINDEVCSLLKQMNVRSISLGLESGSPEILNFLKGSSVTVKHNFTAVETIKKHGLGCIGSFVIGAPNDTKETILDTLNFIKRSKLDEFAVFPLTPFPGTPMWEYAEKEGLLPDNHDGIDWNRLDIEYEQSHTYNIHLAKYLSRDELYKLYLSFKKEQTRRNINKAARLLFSNPTRLLYHINKRIKSYLIKLRYKSAA